MYGVDVRVAAWVDVVADILQQPIREFPIELVSRSLIDTFEARVGYLEQRLDDGSVQITVFSRPGETFGGFGSRFDAATEYVRNAANSELMNHHPLPRWFAAGGGTLPQTLQRANTALGSGPRTGDAIDVLRSVGVDQEMTIPLFVRGMTLQQLGTGRPGSDFSDEELLIATRLQPLFMSLKRQAEVLRRLLPDRVSPELGLTGRELAVLQLVATGRTATAIGSVLGCSRRTVQKHVEHIYRKLEVGDRVSAVRIGHEAGLLRSDDSARRIDPRTFIQHF